MSFPSRASSGSGEWAKPPSSANSLGKRRELAQNTDLSAAETISDAEGTSAPFRGNLVNHTSSGGSGSSSNRWARTATDSSSMGTSAELVLRSRPSGKWAEASNEQQQCYGQFVARCSLPTYGEEKIESHVGPRHWQTEMKGATLPCRRMSKFKHQEEIILVRKTRDALKKKCEDVEEALIKCESQLETEKKKAIRSHEKLTYHMKQIREYMQKRKEGQKVDEKDR